MPRSSAPRSRPQGPLLDRLTLCHLNFSDKSDERLRKRWGPRLEFVTQDEWR